MKQILTAGVLAIGIHGILLGIDFKWPERISIETPKSRVLNITLTSLPIKTAFRPVSKEPKPVFKAPVPVDKKINRPERKRVVKFSPQKKDQVPIQTRTKDIAEKTPEKTEQIFEAEESKSKLEQTTTKELSGKNEQNISTSSQANLIHEARPIYRSNPPPKYPRVARIRGYQGEVMLNVLVNKNGRVSDLKVVKSSGYPLLDRAAKSSVKEWLFEPGMVGNNKTTMWVRVPIRFELK